MSCRHGLRAYPVVGLDIEVTSARREEGASSIGAFRACGATALRQLFLQNRDHHVVLEPVMDVEITAPVVAMGDIITDLTALRRGELKEVVETGHGGCIITALVPLQTLLGYATALRSKSHGEATFSAEFAIHRPVTPS